MTETTQAPDNARVIAEFRKTGQVSGELAGVPLLLLTTYAPDARLRTVPLLYLPGQEDGWLVFAAHAGADKDPKWCMDLRHDPAAKVEVPEAGDISEFWVDAMFLTDAVRQHYYDQMCEAFPRYREFAERTAREIPVIALNPVHRLIAPVSRCES